jgi:hypothetical protein
MSDLGMASIGLLTEHIYLFAGLWMLVFGLAPALVSRFTVSRSPVPIPPPSSRPVPYPMVFGIMIGLAFASWAALAIAWNDFTFPDGQILFSGVRGERQFYPPPIWPTAGRFFPLGHQEFELLGLIDTSGVVYYLFAAFQLAAVCVAAVALVRPSWPLALLLVLALVAAPPVSTDFTGLIMPERNLIFLLAISLVCLRSYLSRSAPLAIFLAMAAMAPMVLYKETAFIFPAVIGFALGAAYFAPRLFQEADGDRRRYLVAGVPMLVLAGAFLLYYVAVIRPEVNVSYAAARASDLGKIGADIIVQPWCWVLAGSIVVRLWFLLARRHKLDPFWDSLPAATVVYIAAFFVLRLNGIRFVAPPAFISWLYAFHILVLVASDRHGVWLARAGAVVLAACVILQLGPTWNMYTGRREMMYARASAARFVADYAKIENLGTPERPLHVHVLGVSSFIGGSFGAFINARYGLDVVIAIPGNDGKEPSLCVGPDTTICDPGRPRDTGDLVVPLLGGDKDLRERQDLRLLFTSDDIGFWKSHPWRHVSVYIVD